MTMPNVTPVENAEPSNAKTSPPRKTVLAAALLLAMFLLSGSLAVYSAWLLWRGEVAEAVLSGLPGGCEQVVLIDKPRTARHVADHVAKQSVTWTGGDVAASLLRGIPRDPPPMEVDVDQALALCFRHGRWFGAAVPARGVPAAQAARAFAQWIGEAMGQGAGTPSHRSATKGKWGRWISGSANSVQWVAREGNDVVQATWTSSATTPTDSVEQAESAMDEMLAALQTRTAQKDEPFRAALERTGGGDVHTFERGPALERTLKSAPGWTEAAQTIEWRGAALRVDSGNLTVHEHLGGGQRFAAWLKRRFDMPTAFDAAKVLPATGFAQWGVDRYPHLLAVNTDLTVASLPGRRMAMPSPTAATDKVWNSFLTGPVAWFASDDGCLVFAAVASPVATALPQGLPPANAIARCSAPVHKLIAGLLLTGPPQQVAVLEQVALGKVRSLADTDPSRDVRRMAETTNGWRSATASGLHTLEWTWVDTGVVVERTYGIR